MLHLSTAGDGHHGGKGLLTLRNETGDELSCRRRTANRSALQHGRVDGVVYVSPDSPDDSPEMVIITHSILSVHPQIGETRLHATADTDAAIRRTAQAFAAQVPEHGL